MMRGVFFVLIVTLLACAPVLVFIKFDEFASGELSMFGYVIGTLHPVFTAILMIVIYRRFLARRGEDFDA